MSQSFLKNNTNDPFFCILGGTNSDTQSQYIAVAGAASAVLESASKISTPLGFLTAVGGLYDALSSVSTGSAFADVIFPNDSINREAMPFTVTTVSLFRYSFRDGVFRIEFATNTLRFGDNWLSNVFLNPITIFQQLAPGMSWECYRAFVLQLTPSPGYKPSPEPNSSPSRLEDQSIISGPSSQPRRYYRIGTLPHDCITVLGNDPSDSNRGQHLVLVQKQGVEPDDFTSIRFASSDNPSAYVYLWILNGFAVRGSATETGRIGTVVTIAEDVYLANHAQRLVTQNAGHLGSGRFYKAFDWSPVLGKLFGYELLGAVVVQKENTAFVVLRSIMLYHSFYSSNNS